MSLNPSEGTHIHSSLIFSALLSLSLSLSFFTYILAQEQVEGQQYPLAEAGADQSVKEGDIVVLNGTGKF